MVDEPEIPDESSGVQIHVRLKDVNDIPTQYVNQVHADVDRAGVYIVMSSLVPLFVTSQADRDQLLERPYVNAQVVAKVFMPPTVVRETIDLLNLMLERQEAAEQTVATATAEEQS